MTNTQTKEKPAKPAANAEAAEFASFEVPAAMREFAEKGVQQAHGAYQSCKAVAEEATGALEESFATAGKAATDIQAATLSAARANVNAGFEFAEKMLSVKSLAEAVELQSQFARSQFDAFTEQARQFQTLTSRTQAEAAKPFREGLAKAMTQFKPAA